MCVGETARGGERDLSPVELAVDDLVGSIGSLEQRESVRVYVSVCVCERARECLCV